MLPDFSHARIFSSGRIAKYLRGLLASYGSVGVVFLFTAITVPLGVSSMGLEGWGIWIFCQQASAAIGLLESLTQSAFVRLLVQVKDDPSSEDYKKMVLMGRRSFRAQGLLLLLFHAGFAALLPALFPNFSGASGWETVGLLGISSFVNQLGKINGQLLYAHQHQDRAVFSTTLGLLVGLLMLLFCLPRFAYPQTMACSFILGGASSQYFYWLFARRQKCLPTFPGTPKLRWQDFRPLWFWGRQFFLFSFLNNLASNLPTLLAGRFLPLEIVGVWGVLQRVANMVSQIVLKFPQLAAPVLMEMHARGEEKSFQKRANQILWIQDLCGSFILGVLATGGSFLLAAWLGKVFVLNFWILPLFALALFADFDQRFRFDVETTRLQMKRPTAAAFAKVFLILAFVPFLSHDYGLLGMAMALGVVYILFLLPLSLSSAFFPSSYSLSWKPTLIGAIVFILTAFMTWLARFFLS